MIEMGTIWDRTLAFIGDHMRAIVPVALLAIWLPATVATVIAGAVQGCAPAIGPIAGSLLAVVAALVALWGQLALTALALDAPRAAAGRAFPRAVGAMVLLLAVIVVLALPLVLFGGATIGVHDGCSDAVAAGDGTHIDWFRGLYFVGLVLVGAVILTRMTMLYPVTVAQGGVVAAIRRGWTLSRGLFWKLLGVWFVFGLVYGVARLATQFAFGALLGLVLPEGGAFGAAAILTALLVAAVQTAFTVIVATFAALLYRAITGSEGARAAA